MTGPDLVPDPDPTTSPDQPDPVDPLVCDHDPTGTDLASRVARMARGTRRRPRPSRRQPTWSGSGDDPRDPKRAGDLLHHLIEANGWQVEVNVHLVAGRWSQVVGDDVARHSTPEAFESGVLTVRTDTTAWAVQLRHLAAQILARVNAAVGDGAIARIDFCGPEAPQRRTGRFRIKGDGPRDTWG